MAKLEIGTIVEFCTSKGLAYAQVSHNHQEYSNLLRVYDGFYDHRPYHFEPIVNQPVRFSAFIRLNSAVKRGNVEIAGRVAVPQNLQEFPLFRAGSYDLATDTNGAWWLWDGQREWMVGDLSADEWKYPLRGVWNTALFVERLESGWVQEGARW